MFPSAVPRSNRHSGHEALNDAELVIHDLGDGGQAVGGAGGVGDDL